VNIWSKEEAKFALELKALRQEVAELRAQVREKDLLIDALENQITKS
jgi:hypothetical protein